MAFKIRWRTIRVWASALGGVVAALATAYLAKANADADFGTGRGRTIAIVTVGTIAIVSALARPVRFYVLERAERESGKIAVAMRGLAWTVHGLTDVDVKGLGASAWVPSGYVVTGWRVRRKLHRVARERVNDAPAPSGITWIKNKGAVGRCWALGREEVHDAGRFDKKHASTTRAAWDGLTKAERKGLSFGEFRKITGKYGTVVTVPIVGKSEKVIGVVALDTPPGCSHARFSRNDVKEAVAEAASVVAQLID